MRFIVITPPDFIPGEAELIARLFYCGLDTLHLRKPGSSIETCARLLDALPKACLRRIVTHEHFTLCRDYGLQGIHLNRRNPDIPAFIRADKGSFTVSASCHSIAETAARKPETDYVFMSPIFNSISKQGYAAAYTDEALTQAASRDIIDGRVVALGGITYDKISQLRDWHFGGAAFLGDVWNKVGLSDFNAHAKSLANELHRIFR